MNTRIDCRKAEPDDNSRCKWCGRPVKLDHRLKKSVHRRGVKRIWDDPRKEAKRKVIASLMAKIDRLEGPVAGGER